MSGAVAKVTRLSRTHTVFLEVDDLGTCTHSPEMDSLWRETGQPCFRVLPLISNRIGAADLQVCGWAPLLFPLKQDCELGFRHFSGEVTNLENTALVLRLGLGFVISFGLEKSEVICNISTFLCV